MIIPRQLLETEKAWLAAAIDGEGSVGLYHRAGAEGRVVTVQISNTCREFVEEVRRIIGSGSSIMMRKFSKRDRIRFSHAGRKTLYSYQLKNALAVKYILNQILPYLIIKKQKSRDIIKELETKPFGVEAHRTLEYRKRLSYITKNSWNNPTIRMKRTNGIRKFRKEIREKNI